MNKPARLPVKDRRSAGTRLSTPGYKALIFEFGTMFGDDDPWGTTMEWWFAVAETLFHSGETLPDSWQFRDSPMHGDGYEPEGYADEMLYDLLQDERVTLADIRTLGDVVNRYAAVLKAAGRDY